MENVESTVTVNTDTRLVIDTEARNFLLGMNRTETKSYTAAADVDLAQGLIVAYDAATDKLIPYVPAGTGSETIPFGCVINSVSVLSGATISLQVVIAGDVDKTIAVEVNTEAVVNTFLGGHYALRFIQITEVGKFN